MNKLTAMVLAAVLAVFFCAHPASAQVLSIASGNGQLVKPNQFFAPIGARVTDSNGVGQANVAVNWTITTGGFNALLLSGPTTITDGTGTAYNTYSNFGYLPSGSYIQSQVTASIANASAVTFILTQSLFNPNPASQNSPAVTVAPRGVIVNLLAGQVLTGQAGTTSSTPLQIFVSDLSGAGVPNISVQLVNYQDPSSGPVVNCAGAAGGEPNTVLTDASSVATTGLASCYPVFGGIPGSGRFYVLVGAGGIPLSDPTNPGYANWITLNMNMSVTAAQPGLIKITQGNGQSAAPGQALSTPLQVEVDTASGVPVAGQSVNWTVSPAGAVGSLPTTTSTDANGHTSINATLAANASGTVQIRATCPACPSAASSVIFTATAVPLVTLSGVQIISGNNQTSAENMTFGSPLVVQVNVSTGQAAPSGVLVTFALSGPASLSSTMVDTDPSGRAQVGVTAGATSGAVTVTATAGSFSQTFNLTVSPPVPPAPTLTAANFFNGADFQAGSISPCSIATIIAPGLASGIQGVVTPGSLFGALPLVLASDAVSFNGVAAPIFNVANVNGQQQITVQVPCEAVPGNSVPVSVTVGSAAPATVNVPVLAASPGIFQTAMSDGVLRAVAVRPDGSWVSLVNPARRGEIVRAYATGLGVTSPAVGTNATAIPGTDAIVQGTLIMGVTNTANQGEGVRVSTARVAPDLIGVFEIPFMVPSDAATGFNVSFSIGVIPVGSGTPIYSATAKIPIQ